ncbi:MAG: phospholipase A2 [Acidimicrobiales bacterium]
MSQTQIAPFPDDGGACTGVPDAIPGIFDFTDACAAHDACYASGDQTQAQCDESFRQDMVATCAAQFPSALDPGRYLCLTFAQLYFFGVTLFGGFFF